MLKLFFLFLALWFSIINFIGILRGSDIPTLNLLLHAIGLTGFIYLQWVV